MFSLLDRLREMPEHKRSFLAILITIFFTLVIFTGWIYSKKIENGIFASEIVVEKEKNNSNSPISYISKNVKSIFVDMKEIVEEVKKIDSISTTSEEEIKVDATDSGFYEDLSNKNATSTFYEQENLEFASSSATSTSATSTQVSTTTLNKTLE